MDQLRQFDSICMDEWEVYFGILAEHEWTTLDPLQGYFKSVIFIIYAFTVPIWGAYNNQVWWS